MPPALTVKERRTLAREARKAGQQGPTATPQGQDQARIQRKKLKRVERKQRSNERKATAARAMEERKAGEQDQMPTMHANAAPIPNASPASAAGFVNGQQLHAPTAAFDYASAPSVLHAAQQNGGSAQQAGPGKKKNRKNKRQKAKPMNPYADALAAAPSGLPRAQKPKAGRSGTWTGGT